MTYTGAERRKRKSTVLQRASYDWTRVNPMRATDTQTRTAPQQAEDILTGRASVPQKSTDAPPSLRASDQGFTVEHSNAPPPVDTPLKRKGRPPGSKNVHSSTITPQEIKAIRLAQGGHLSQAEFGELVGVHRTTVYQWEIGERTPSKQSETIIRSLLPKRNE